MFKVDINKIRGEFIDRVSDTIIYDVSTKFSKINSVVGLEDNIETVISKYLSGLLEKRDLNKQISQINHHIRKIDDGLKKLESGKIEKLRKQNKLSSYLNLKSNKQIDTMLELELINSEEGSNIKLQRFKDKRDENVMSTQYSISDDE